MLHGDLREMFTVNSGDHVGRDNNSARAILLCLGYGLVDVNRRLNAREGQPDAEPLRCELEVSTNLRERATSPAG